MDSVWGNVAERDRIFDASMEAKQLRCSAQCRRLSKRAAGIGQNDRSMPAWMWSGSVSGDVDTENFFEIL